MRRSFALPFAALSLSACSVTLDFDGFSTPVGASGGSAGTGQSGAGGRAGALAAGAAGAAAGQAGAAAGQAGAAAGQAGAAAGQAGAAPGGAGGGGGAGTGSAAGAGAGQSGAAGALAAGQGGSAAGQAGSAGASPAGAGGSAGTSGAAGAGAGGAGGSGFVAEVEELGESPTEAIRAFVSDGTEIFWLTSTGIFAAPLAEAGPKKPPPKARALTETTPLSGGTHKGLAKVGNTLYWMSPKGSVCRAQTTSKSAGCQTPVWVSPVVPPGGITGAGLVAFLAKGESYLAFATDAGAVGSSAKIVAMKVSLDGTGQGSPFEIASHDEKLIVSRFTTAATANGPLVAWGELKQLKYRVFAPGTAPSAGAPLGALSDSTLISLAVSPDGLKMASANQPYLFVSSTSAISYDPKLRLADTPPSTPGDTNPANGRITGLAFPDNAAPNVVYAADTIAGRILALPTNGSAPITDLAPYAFVENQIGVYNLAAAGGYLYWFTSATPSKLRRCKLPLLQSRQNEPKSEAPWGATRKLTLAASPLRTKP